MTHLSKYRQISELVPRLHGWCDIPKAITLFNMVTALKPAMVVEIGTWGGRSAIPMALASREHKGLVLCVDPWSGEASIEGQVTEADKQWWAANDKHQVVFQDFIQHRQALGLENTLLVHRMKSDDFKPPAMQLLHVDGNHGPQAYTDTVRYGALVQPGGICVLDDLSWTGGHVERAKQWLLDNGFIELHKLGTGAAYLRMA